MSNPDNDIAYPNYPLTLEEGEEKLKDAVRQFHASMRVKKEGQGLNIV